MNDFYQRKDISKDTIELKITIPNDSFVQSYKALLKDQLKDTSVKGFRKGKVPSKLIEPQISESVKFEALEKLAPMYITTAVQKENLEPIAPPEYKDLPKIEEGKDVEFTITLTILPAFKLGNMKKINIKKEDVKITKEEIESALEDIKKNNKTKINEINDDWAKEVSKILELEKVTTVEELKKQIEEAMKSQKEHMLLHKRQEEALDQAIKLSNIEIPTPAIKYEAIERERSFTNDMKRKGVNIDEFIKVQGLTIEKMRELWEKDAKEALQTDTFLKLYIKEKNINITEEELEKRIEEIKKTAPKGTDSSIYDNEDWRAYVMNVDLKQKAFEAFVKDVLGDTHKD